MKHTHKYKRINIGQNGKMFWVMKCIKPGCTHYTPMKTKNSAPLLRGTIAECNKCCLDFILTRYSLTRANPCCDDCRDRRVNLNPVDKFFEELESSIK